ncbi:MAG: efflux RND transporter permease subunit [bacterium]
MKSEPLGFTAKIVDVFLTSKLSPLLIVFSLLAGIATLVGMPREEEPQIVVPVADVLVSFPGASAREVEDLVSNRLESLLWEIDGVEHVYSMARPGEAVVTVRFKVGEDRERSIVKLYNKISMNVDRVPAGVAGWVVKPIEIDDLPFVTLTLFAERGSEVDEQALREIARETAQRLGEVSDTARITVIGGRAREVAVAIDPARLAARRATTIDVLHALAGASSTARAGSLVANGRETAVDVGPALASAADVEALVIGVHDGAPVHLGDVATVRDAPESPTSYTRIGFGPGDPESGATRDAVTIAIAKRKGSNAVTVAEHVLARVDELRGQTIPSDVGVRVTRNWGETANEKVNELVKHLTIAVVTIIALLALSLGTREAAIVALAVPMTLALTLLGGWMVGYTINRVTLFALILSLGLLVDDPIVDVENIHRHFQLGRLPPREATLFAVDEVRPPTILATIAVILSFLPMFFVTGMMGPYMRPMPYHVPLAMVLSLVMAFTVTPWASYRLLRKAHPGRPAPGGAPGGSQALAQHAEHDTASGPLVDRYRRFARSLLGSRRRGTLFLGAVVVALLASVALAAMGLVPMKMLPFGNKDELVVVIDAPDGTALEDTDRVTREVEEFFAALPEVRDFQSYVGEAGPTDMNGMVRHYFLRRGGSVGEVRVNLLPKHERQMQSHEIALRIRPEIERIAARTGASLKIVETPPGPPVLATVVAEVYGPEHASYTEIAAEARRIEGLFRAVPGVVDVDSTAEEPRSRWTLAVDREKAALHGIAPADVVKTLGAALGGADPAALQVLGERDSIPVRVRLAQANRARIDDALALEMRAGDGSSVRLGALVRAVESAEEITHYHKDLRRFAFVTAEVAGTSPVEAVFGIERQLEAQPSPSGFKIDMAGEGEWKITVDVFRDLGLAFGVALAGIYVLLAAQTQSFGIPLVIMAAIPLTLIGILPGFWLLNVVAGKTVAGYTSPIFFTATAMIGMIALAGIVVRNSIILIDFIEVERSRGRPLAEAVVEAGAVRLRPILLTAGAAIFGAWVITLDPIFSGLAWAFIFGIFASTLFTLGVVPVIYAMVRGAEPAATRPSEGGA